MYTVTICREAGLLASAMKEGQWEPSGRQALSAVVRNIATTGITTTQETQHSTPLSDVRESITADTVSGTSSQYSTPYS